MYGLVFKSIWKLYTNFEEVCRWCAIMAVFYSFCFVAVTSVGYAFVRSVNEEKKESFKMDTNE
jgi:hypothetical protein